MADNTVAFSVIPPLPTAQDALIPEPEPKILWGQGTPDGDREPFISANKGSLYLQVNATDDTSHVWQKVDEANDNNDWILFEAGAGSISNADIVAGAGIVGSKLATNARRHFAVSKDFNIDNGSGTTDDDIILVPSDGITVVAVRAVYIEATDSAGAASATFEVGTTVGGAELVAATNLEVSKAVGSFTAGTLVTGAGAVAADGMIAVRHTGIAATEAGQYFVQVEFTVDD